MTNHSAYRFQAAKVISAVALSVACHVPGHAEMVLSQVIVDMQPPKPSHGDIEVWNTGPERMYVVAEPAEIKLPGTAAEQRSLSVDPAVTGLLVTPQRLVLEPGERRIVRVAAVTPRVREDRIYRVTMRPVAGDVSADTTALKVLVGYDVLVLLRPDNIAGDLTATREGRRIVIRNETNTAQELFDGEQCDMAGGNCKALPSRRLYAGNAWEQDLPYDTPITYTVSAGSGSTNRSF